MTRSCPVISRTPGGGAAGPRSQGAPTDPVVCEGEGNSGKRVAALYVHAEDKPSRYDLFLPSFRAWMVAVDDAYTDSAAETGGSRHVRYVTKKVSGGCRIVVANLALPPEPSKDWAATVKELESRRYDRTDRKYLIIADSDTPGFCGAGDTPGDDRPGKDGRFNQGPNYARVDTGCWGSNAFAHELGHVFGAVLPGSTNS